MIRLSNYLTFIFKDGRLKLFILLINIGFIVLTIFHSFYLLLIVGLFSSLILVLLIRPYLNVEEVYLDLELRKIITEKGVEKSFSEVMVIKKAVGAQLVKIIFKDKCEINFMLNEMEISYKTLKEYLGC